MTVIYCYGHRECTDIMGQRDSVTVLQMNVWTVQRNLMDVRVSNCSGKTAELEGSQVLCIF